MKPTRLSSLFFILSLFLISHAPMPALCDKLYETVCVEAKDDTNSCLLLLETDPRITSSKSFTELSTYILSMAIKKAQEAQDYFGNLMNRHPTEAIKLCATEWYSGAVSSFANSLDELIKDPGEANGEASRAGYGASDCENAVVGENLTNDPRVHFYNNQTLLLSKIAALATNHLIKKSD